ncbi:TerC family protein [Nannocystis punicea]|uniref:TerC family protein n=1 Tax=Nannocystis punicea TaxID=2995304 RepID=A0ABY7H300_9BACT|nr:TerC family protein [Nannocystis poenicansa]WAS93612.1 TerC family protein [Nannocystis poenicansa]
MFDPAALATPEVWISLLTLSALEIVLGLDNIIFISILVGKLPEANRDRARRIGLMGAFVTRLGLLATLSWIMHLDKPFFELLGHPFTGKEVVLLLGGLFLIYKSTKELHDKIEGDPEGHVAAKGGATVSGVIFQILLLDLVFSIDSVITAVGMAQDLWIMVAANVLALGVMLMASKSIAVFVDRHPTIKVLALSFLLTIGLLLTAEAFEIHVPKGYIYFAMAYSVGIEMINIRIGRKAKIKHAPETDPQSAHPF